MMLRIDRTTCITFDTFAVLRMLHSWSPGTCLTSIRETGLPALISTVGMMMVVVVFFIVNTVCSIFGETSGSWQRPGRNPV